MQDSINTNNLNTSNKIFPHVGLRIRSSSVISVIFLHDKYTTILQESEACFVNFSKWLSDTKTLSDMEKRIQLQVAVCRQNQFDYNLAEHLGYKGWMHLCNLCPRRLSLFIFAIHIWTSLSELTVLHFETKIHIILPGILFIVIWNHQSNFLLYMLVWECLENIDYWLLPPKKNEWHICSLNPYD